MWDALRFLVVIEAIGILALPVTAALLRRLPGEGLAFAKPLGLLLAAYPAWLIASLHLLPFGRALALLGVAGLAGVGVRRWRRGWRPVGERIARRGWYAAEAVFLVTFVVGALVASFSADVRGTEKPMDMAILASTEASDSFPPHNPWLSGSSLNYYYFGHYLMAFVVRIAGVEPSVGYNLSLALLFALTCTAAFGLAWTIGVAGGSRRAWLVGLLGAGAVAIAGTIDAAQQLFVDGGPLRGYDWFAPARLLDGAITEFPAFSFTLGDLHAHVLALPWVIVALAFGLQVVLGGPTRRDAIAAGVVVGALYAINAWAFPMTLAVLVASTVVWLRDPRLPSSPGAAAAWAGGVVWVGVLAYAPYWLTYDPSPSGVGWVDDHAPLGDLLRDLVLFFGVFGWVLVAGYAGQLIDHRHQARRLLLGLAGLVAACVVTGSLAGVVLLAVVAAVALHAAVTRIEGVERFVWLLAAAGVACIGLRELVYVRDGFDGSALERLNTIFKLDYQAWVLLGLAAAGALPWGRRRLPAAAWPIWGSIAVGFGILALVYPVAGTYGRSNGFADGPRLTGTKWLATSAPGDVEAIRWLRANTPGDAVVLEAAGEDYSTFGHGRISTFSGRATVIEWPQHVELWGGDVGRRMADVGAAYRSADRAVVGRILDRYGVDYVVQGTLERSDYGGEQAAFDALGRRVAQFDGAVVWRVTRSDRT